MNEPVRETLERLRDADPSGRFDVLAYRFAEKFVKQLEPRMNNLPVWDKGLGDIVEAGIREIFPARKFTPVDVARELGILPRVVPNRGRRARA